MNSVYIYNANLNKDFSSLLMNDLNIRGISFSNLSTTKRIHTNNVLVYIPKVGIGVNNYADIVSGLGNIEHTISDFRVKIIPFISYDDYRTIRTIFDNYFGKNNFRYYQAIAFDTLYSRIVASECARIIRRS